MADRPTIVLVGTLDTKGHEYAYLRERIEATGAAAVMIDTGVLVGPRCRRTSPGRTWLAPVAPSMPSWRAQVIAARR